MKRVLVLLALGVMLITPSIALGYAQVNGDSLAILNAKASMTALTGADSTNYVYCRDSAEITWTFTTSSVTGTDSVIVQVEGSVDGTRWFNLDNDGSTTITSNTTSAFRFTGLRSIPYTRFRVVRVVGTVSISAISAKPR
jgi:hypothetical protein